MYAIVYATILEYGDYVEPMIFYFLAFLGTLPLYISHLIPGIALVISAAFFAFWYLAAQMWLLILFSGSWCWVEFFFFAIAEAGVVGFLAVAIYRLPLPNPQYM